MKLTIEEKHDIEAELDIQNLLKQFSINKRFTDAVRNNLTITYDSGKIQKNLFLEGIEYGEDWGLIFKLHEKFPEQRVVLFRGHQVKYEDLPLLEPDVKKGNTQYLFTFSLHTDDDFIIINNFMCVKDYSFDQFIKNKAYRFTDKQWKSLNSN